MYTYIFICICIYIYAYFTSLGEVHSSFWGMLLDTFQAPWGWQAQPFGWAKQARSHGKSSYIRVRFLRVSFKRGWKRFIYKIYKIRYTRHTRCTRCTMIYKIYKIYKILNIQDVQHVQDIARHFWQLRPPQSATLVAHHNRESTSRVTSRLLGVDTSRVMSGPCCSKWSCLGVFEGARRTTYTWITSITW